VIGDIKKSTPGEEIVVVDNSGQAFVVYKEGDNWGWQEIFKDSKRLRDAIIADLDFDHPGDEILAVGSSGNATLLWEEGGILFWYGPTRIERTALRAVNLIVTMTLKNVWQSDILSEPQKYRMNKQTRHGIVRNAIMVIKGILKESSKESAKGRNNKFSLHLA